MNNMNPLKKIIRKIFFESLITEAEDIYVKYFAEEDNLETLLDICHFVVRNISKQLIPELNLTPEEAKQTQGLMYDFSPDGQDAFNDVGTMNFYCKKFPIRTHEKIIGFIKWILSEKNITVGEITSEDYDNPRLNGIDHNIRVYRIQIVKNEHESDLPPNMHLSSSTWQLLMEDILGFEDYQDDISVDKLERNIKIAKATIELKGLPNNTEYQKKGRLFIPNKGKNYILDLMDVLESLCKWCKERGYTSIYIA